MIRLRLMTFEDITFGLRLKQKAGWNQTPADWARFLSLQPDGCFLAELDRTPVGTVTTVILGTVAWIGMMLVEQSLRGQGIGRALMTRALEFLEGKGIRSIRLDATPMGEQLYRSLGFVPQFALSRFGGEFAGAESGGIPHTDGLEVEPGLSRHWESAAHLDRQVTGTDRRRLLFELFREQPRWFRVVQRGGAVVGFLAARRGTRALQVGPCIATAEAGPLLLADAARRFAGREVFLDVPQGNEPAMRWARQMGLLAQRDLLRMCRGEQVEESVGQLWASSGPEKG
jgi:GNAT superfamily N-acetyltransferase